MDGFAYFSLKAASPIGQTNFWTKLKLRALTVILEKNISVSLSMSPMVTTLLYLELTAFPLCPLTHCCTFPNCVPNDDVYRKFYLL